MTVSNQNQKSTAAGNGNSHQFNFNFKIALAADLVVLVRTDATGATVTKVLNTDYIIPTSSINADNGGNILFKFNTGTSSDAHFDTTDRRPPAGTTVILKRQVQLTQGVDLQAASSLPAETLENAYDKVTHGLQQLQEQMDRALLRPASDSASAALPDNVDLKGKVLQFNATSGAPEAVAGLTDAATSSTPGLMSAADKSKLDGIEAGATGDQDAAEIRTLVESATDSNVFTDADHSKLNNIEASATADQTDSEIKTAYENNANTNALTDTLLAKLNNIEANATIDQTDAEIKTAYENNSDTNAFSDAEKTKLTGIETGATADQDASEIRTLVESATNSNVFTDADHTKLNNIENNATADQTDSEIRALVASATDSNVFTDADHTKLDGIETGATADQNASDIRGLGFFDVSNDGTGSGLDADLLDGQEGTYYQAASTALTTSTSFGGDVSGAYNAIVIADDSHNHVISNVDGLQDALNAKAPLASPALTGTPTAPTAAVDDSTTKIATTAFVQQELTALVDSAPNTLNTLNEIAAAINDDPNFNTTVTNSLGNRLRIDVNNQSLTATQKSNATTNLGLSAVATSGAYSDISGTPSAATTGAAGLMSAADKTKIDGIESNATADQTASEIKTLYENNSNTNALTDALLSKLNAIEASATADQTASEIRTLVESATDSNVFTDADHTKLNAIEAGATADQTNEEIQDIVGAMLTSNTETGITVTYQDADGTIDFVVASQTDENFTSADHSKLDAIEAGATADQTAAEIRTLVDSATDSNVFTDADHTKLNGIESNATADQTASEILTAIKTVDGATSGLDADLLDGQEGSYYLDYSNFSNTPTIPTNNNQLTNGAGFITSADGGNAQTLDSLDSTSFLRSDAADTKTSGNLTFSDDVNAVFGTGSDLQIYHDGSNSYIDQNDATLFIRNTSDTGNASGNGIDIRNADNTGIEIPNNSGVMIKRSGNIDVSFAFTGAFFNTDIVLNGATKEIKWRDTSSGNYFLTLDAEQLTGSDKTITLPNANGTVALNESGILNLTNSGSQSELRLYCESANAHYAALKAPAHSAFSGNVTLTLPNNTGTLINSVGNTSIQFLGANNAHKIQFWNATTQYSMGMGSGYSFGSLGGAGSEYAIVTTMSNTDARGFIWRDNAHTGAQGAMSLTTTGKMTVADSIRVGYGESDSVVSGTTHDLEVNGSFSASGLAYPSSDGSADQVIKTDGSGNLSFATVSGGSSSGNGFFVIEAERSGSAALDQYFAFGNGASTAQGVRIPIGTTLKYLTVTCDAGSQTATFELYVNNTASGQTISLSNGQKASSSELNYSISADDNISFKVTSGSTNSTTTIAAWFAAGITNTNADTVDSKHISVVTSLPASPDSNTIYFVTS